VIGDEPGRILDRQTAPAGLGQGSRPAGGEPEDGRQDGLPPSVAGAAVAAAASGGSMGWAGGALQHRFRLSVL